MTEHDHPRAKPTNYDELFPGRFLKAGLFLGKTPTYTIASIDLEALPQDNGTVRDRGIVSFRETPLGVVLNSTNGQCLKAMWGAAVRAWIGKRVTLCTEKDRDPCGKGLVDAIRVLGSPDLDDDLTVEIKMPRRKPKTRTLRKTGEAQESPPAATRKTRGDLDDAVLRLRQCPKSELGQLVSELATAHEWSEQDRAALNREHSSIRKSALSVEIDPDNDGR